MPMHVDAVFEQGVFRPLSAVSLPEGEKVSLEIQVNGKTAAEPLKELPEWCNVYAGMSDKEIAELEKIILDRSNFMRPPRLDEE